MAEFALGPGDSIHYVHQPPQARRGWTFVFFNDLFNDSQIWEAAVAPALRRAGHGTLIWNYRGQPGSRCAPTTSLQPDAIAGDAVRLIGTLSPVRPVLVGLAVGGIIAGLAVMAGADAKALVLINALRRHGARQRWISDAIVRCIKLGGTRMVLDLYAPLLYNEDWLEAHRQQSPKLPLYRAFDDSDASVRLFAEAGTADWDLPYDKLRLPTVVVTGLQDRLFVDPGDVERIAARLPDTRRYDFHNAGHFAPVERPQLLTTALIDLVEKRLAGDS